MLLYMKYNAFYGCASVKLLFNKASAFTVSQIETFVGLLIPSMAGDENLPGFTAVSGTNDALFFKDFDHARRPWIA